MADRTISVYITGDASSLEQAAANAKAAIDALVSTDTTMGIKPSPETDAFMKQLDEVKAKLEGLNNAEVKVTGTTEKMEGKTKDATKAITEAGKASGKGQHAFSGFTRGILSSTLHIGGLITPARLLGTTIGTILVAAISQGIAAAEQFDAVMEKLATGTMNAQAATASYKAANQLTWVASEQVAAVYGQMIRMQNITWNTTDAYAALSAQIATFADEAQVDAGAVTRGIVDMQQAFNIDPKAGMRKWFEFFAYSAKFNEVGSNINLMIEGNTKSAQLAFEQLGYSAERYLLILGGMAHQGANITKLTNVMKLFTANMPAGTTETVMKNKWANLVNTLTSNIDWTLKQQALDAAGIAGRSQKEIEELSTWLQMSGPYYKRDATGEIAKDVKTGKPIVAASITDAEAIKSLPSATADTAIEATKLIWKGVLTWLGDTAQSVYNAIMGTGPEQNVFLQTIQDTLTTLQELGVDYTVDANDQLVETWQKALEAAGIRGPSPEQLKNVKMQQVLKDLWKFGTGEIWKDKKVKPLAGQSITDRPAGGSSDSGVTVAGFDIPTMKEFEEAQAFMESLVKTNPSFNTMGVLKGYFQKIYDYWLNLFLSDEFRNMDPFTLNQSNALKELTLMRNSMVPVGPQSRVPGVDYEAFAYYKATKSPYGENPEVGGATGTGEQYGGTIDIGLSSFKGFADVEKEKVETSIETTKRIIRASENAAKRQTQNSRLTLAWHRDSDARKVRSSVSAYQQILWASNDAMAGMGDGAADAEGRITKTMWNIHTAFGNIPIDVSKVQDALKGFGVNVPAIFDNLLTGAKRIGSEWLTSMGLEDDLDSIKKWVVDLQKYLESMGLDLAQYWKWVMAGNAFTLAEINKSALDSLKLIAGDIITMMSGMFAEGEWDWNKIWKRIWQGLLKIAVEYAIKLLTNVSAMNEAVAAINAVLAAAGGDWVKFALYTAAALTVVGTAAYAIAQIRKGAAEEPGTGPEQPPAPVSTYQPGGPTVSAIAPYPATVGASSVIQVNMAGANIYGTIDDASARKIGEGLTRSLAFRGVKPLAYS